MSDLQNRSRGIYGNQYDRFVERYDESTLSKMQQQYWEAKQTFLRKIKRREDDCIVASDADLDTKLELFRAIEESCQDLIYALEAYQDRLCGLAHEENSLGRFLKECGKVDKTRAGKMMTASGKTVCYCAQQRVQLRNPLVRLYQEVETFQYRAVADTLMTIDKMEKSRTAYRGALLWMKDASQQLDPDTYKQLDKFRKVQSHVRRTKARFDKLKLDTQQKIDLLSASRCNMYSYALVGYQNALLQFWEKTSKTMNAVAESFKGYQHYEFNILNELTETSKKLAKETAPDDDLKKIFGEEEDDEDKDKLLFFESEYHDNELKKQIENKSKKANPTKKSKTKHGKKDDSKANQQKDDTLLDLESSSQEAFAKKLTDYSKGNLKDLLTASDLEADDLTVLNDILNAPTTPVIDSSQIANGANTATQIDSFMPSQLIDLDQVFSNLQLNPIQKVNEDKPKTAKKNQAHKQDLSSWFNLFADLDPLANPDSIGRKSDQNDNC